MAEMNSIVTRASEYVFELFKSKLPENLVYHNYAHTQFVADAAEKLARGMKLGEEGTEIVAIAAWFHDAGYTEGYNGHESTGMQIARKFLEGAGYAEAKITLVEGCIAATRIPQRPQNALEEILCDAAMSSAGRKSYFDRLGLLRIEKERAAGLLYSDEEWDRENLDLLASHRYFTRSAQKEYDAQKQDNIRELDRRVRKRATTPPERLALKEETEKIENPTVTKQSGTDTDSESGVETLVRLLSQNHLDLVAQADRKAGTLLLANVLILALLLPTLLGDHHFALPGFILLVVCCVTIVLSVMAARPTLSGGFNREGVENNESDIVEMVKERELLGRKNTYLRWSYTIFLYGLVVSVLVFTWAYHAHLHH